MTREEAIKILMGYRHTPQERAALEVLIPELAVSEDERIREALIHYILYETKGAISEDTEHTWVKWLEKQKDIEDRWIEDRGQCFWDGVEEGKMLAEKLKEQKPAEWSAEDKERLNAIVVLLENTSAIHPNYSRRRLIIWLKSLCPSWKPSEEQMKALNALNLHGDLSYIGQQNQLISLYQDLKKLT